MITAIVCAAGKGERTGFNENKILRELNGLPVLSYSLSAFAPFVDEILVTTTEKDEERINALLSPFPNARIVRGGNTRSESVYHALKEARGDVVLVHDAARPFVTEQIIRDCIDSVKNYGSGVCALPATDTVVFTRANQILSVPDRGTIYTVQTPQGFETKKLLAAYEQAIQAQNTFTDESGVYAAFIEPPRLFVGDVKNKKLTFAEDFSITERVGFGVDTHAFYSEKEGAPLIGFITLGGARIPSERALKAHCDGDVLVHALMDALLSAAGLRDIGYYFPDTDEKYRGADSMELLAEVMRLVKEQQLKLRNVSISILAEKPRLSPYIERIKQKLSDALSIPLSRIGVAAGTNERLGYIGEGKGITVYAMVLLKGA